MAQGSIATDGRTARDRPEIAEVAESLPRAPTS